jgi:hypothetical protein
MTPSQGPAMIVQLHCEQCDVTYAQLPVEHSAGDSIVHDLDTQLTNLRRQHWAQQHQVDWLASAGRNN